MKNFWFLTLGAAPLVLVLNLSGCGGGGGSGPTPNPTPTPTRVPTTNSVLVQLRDTAGAPVDGLVTVNSQTKTTSAGNVSFANTVVGNQNASAEVNGRVYTQNFTATSGASTVQIRIDPTVAATPTPTSPPPPPF